MPQELDTTTIGVILFLGLVAHVVLVVVSKFLNPVLLLGAVFLLLTPLAVAEITGQSAAKWGRVYVTLLVFVVGLFYSKHYKIGPALGTFLVFAGLYFLGSVWSDLMFQAMKFKGLYIALVLAGGFMAYSVRSEADLRSGIRLFVSAGALIAVIMLTDFVRNPAAISNVGRFEPWGLVATRVGAICGPIGIICAFCALYDRSKFWKILAYSVGGSLCLCIIYSGSRGGLFMAGIGCFIIGMPVIKRPVLAAFVLIGALGAFYVVTSLASAGDEEATTRITEVNFDSRASKWQEASDRFAEKPFFGEGWVYETTDREAGSTANMHSLYLQIAVEIGMFGLVAFVLSMIVISTRAMWVVKQARRQRTFVEIAFFAVGLTTAIFCYGIVEAAPITGGTITGMLLPFGIGLIDRLSELIRAEEEWEEHPQHAGEDWGDDWGDDHHDGDSPDDSDPYGEYPDEGFAHEPDEAEDWHAHDLARGDQHDGY